MIVLGEVKRIWSVMNVVSTKSRWDRVYQNSGSMAVPAEVLLENHFLLPEKGCALDLACGLGANALFLAKKGLATAAWDISSVALTKLQKKAELNDLVIDVKQLNIEASCLLKNSFDVIVLSHFLDRSLCNAIMGALKPNGLLFYQTYVREKLCASGPNNPEFLLARNELLTLFNPLKVLFYRENFLAGDLSFGDRDKALFVGQKN